MCDINSVYPRNTKIQYFYVKSLAMYADIVSNLTKVKKTSKQYHEKSNTEKSKQTDIEDLSTPLYWFRGQACTKWPLWPSLYRKIDSKYADYGGLTSNFEQLKVFQTRELSKFYARRSHAISKNRPAPGLPFPITSERKVYSLSIVQHYSENTCLLDWSHQAIVGLFFAIEKYFSDETYTDEKLPCVWMLEPRTLNLTFSGKCAKFFEEELQVLPTFYDIKDGRQKDYIDFPCAIIPPLHNDRILAQAGTYVSFPIGTEDDFTRDNGMGTNGLIRPLDTYTFSHTFLKCIVLWNPRKIAKSLIDMGYDSIDFYPELSNKVQVLSKKWD